MSADAPVILVPYGDDPLRHLATLLLERHKDRLPDLSRQTVLLPHASAVPRFRRLLRAQAELKDFPALLPPVTGTLTSWAARFAGDDQHHLSSTARQILLLDLLKDPQNVGVLLRVADSVGVHGVVIQERRSVSVTPSVVNASSGAVEYLQVAQVTNLVNVMKDLKEQDVWMVGLEAGKDIPPLDKTDLNMALGLVLGSEGEGMRRLVRDTCDLVLCLPMRGSVASLNVATAGAIALYSAWQARGWQGWAHAGGAGSASGGAGGKK